MPAQIYSYEPVVEAGPNGRSLFAKLPEGAIELCGLAGRTYVSVPEGAPIPEQHPEITLSLVTLTPELRDQIKLASRAIVLIDQGVVDTIRGKYSTDDEMYFSRIGVGVALGAYTFEAGEQEALLAFGDFVEACRKAGREQRAALGL